jgi:hypothetical protein
LRPRDRSGHAEVDPAAARSSAKLDPPALHPRSDDIEIFTVMIEIACHWPDRRLASAVS